MQDHLFLCIGEHAESLFFAFWLYHNVEVYRTESAKRDENPTMNVAYLLVSVLRALML